jgi:hypothetical protein
MSTRRRDLLKSLATMGALGPLAASSPFSAMAAQAVADANPDIDPASQAFWSGFTSRVADPIIQSSGTHRGKPPAPGSELQPIFLHFGPEGFKNAAEIDSSGLIADGDVKVGINTSIIKVSPADAETFQKVQNAQIRVDVGQKNAMLPVLEAMAYTAVSGMLSDMKPGSSSKNKSAKSSSSSSGGGGKSSGGSKGGGGGGSVQSIAMQSDPTWQKMQNIILPGGEGRWALNLEAQKKDSLFYKVMELMINNVGAFAPLIGLPGIAMSALQSFNALYGAIHAEPISIIKSDPLRVFATRDAVQKTGAPGAATGILLKTGTYILVPSNQAPKPEDLAGLTVIQGHIVPPKTAITDLAAAAEDTLKDVTYVTFDVQVESTSFLQMATPSSPAKSG